MLNQISLFIHSFFLQIGLFRQSIKKMSETKNSVSVCGITLSFLYVIEFIFTTFFLCRKIAVS